MEQKRKRNYKKEYKDYHGTSEQKKRRAARGRARYEMEKKGKVKKGQEVEHKDGNPNNNKPSNLKTTSSRYQRVQGGYKRHNKTTPKNKKGKKEWQIAKRQKR